MRVLVILLVILTSCHVDDSDYPKYKTEVVKDKVRSVYRGSTVYEVSYESGRDDEVSFGYYSNWNVGDTLDFKQKRNSVWRVIKRRKLINKNK